jgi:hypothetical protein
MEVADALQARYRAMGPREGQGLPRGPHVLARQSRRRRRRHQHRPSRRALLFKDYAVRWMNEYVIANRHSPATVDGRQKCLTRISCRCSATLPIDKIGPAAVPEAPASDRTHLRRQPPSTRSATSSTTMLHVAAEWKLIPARRRSSGSRPSRRRCRCSRPRKASGSSRPRRVRREVPPGGAARRRRWPAQLRDHRVALVRHRLRPW